ncbi:MAG: hypothetical protein ACI959_000592 [Limisphaerales bacterium]|jgi:hypothetical protein
MLKQILFVLILFILCSGVKCFAQTGPQRGLVQFSGVIMSSDSLHAVPYVNIYNQYSGIGAISNYQGFFSLVAGEGDTIQFSSVGYKAKYYVIPLAMEADRYSIIQLLTRDTVHLDVTMIFPWPDPEDFKDAFLALDIPDTYLDRARKNLEREKLREMGEALAPDGNETTDFFFRQEAKKYYYAGQTPPIQLFNVFAWKEFIDAWKRGDFKKDR